MSIPDRPEIVPHYDVPDVLLFTVAPIDKGNHYVHALNLSHFRDVFTFGFSPSNMTSYMNDFDRIHAVLGLETTHDPLVIQVNHGIVRAIVVKPDGRIAHIEEDRTVDGHMLKKQALRPARGLLLSPGDSYALQTLTRSATSITIHRHRAHRSPTPIDPTIEPFHSWFNGRDGNGNPSSDPPLFPNDR